MRVDVDKERCEGNAICVGIASDVFELDDQDHAVTLIDEVSADVKGLVEQAIAECPRAAIMWAS